MPNPHNRHSQLQTLLTQLNLGAIAEVFAEVALRAATARFSASAVGRANADRFDPTRPPATSAFALLSGP